MEKSKKALIICTISFLFFSAVLYHQVPVINAHFDRDSFEYDAIAHNFYRTGNIVNPAQPHQATVQTIGYPFFITLIYRIFGYSHAAVVWVQILLSLLSIYLLVFITYRLCSDTIAALVALLCTVNVGFYVYPQFLLAETVVLVFILASIERLTVFWQSERSGSLVLSGGLLGVSLLIKPAALFFSFFILLMIFLKKQNSCRSVLLFGLCCFMPVVGYMGYNKVKFGYFNIAPMASLNLYQVYLSKIIARAEGISVNDSLKKIPPFSADNLLDESGWDDARIVFKDYIWRYPWVSVMVWIKNVTKKLCGLFSTQLKVLVEPSIRGGDVSFYAMQGSIINRGYLYIIGGTQQSWVQIIALLEALWSGIRYILAALALWILIQQGYGIAALSCCMYIFSFSFITGFDGCARYRLFFEPVLIVLTAIALWHIFAWCTDSKKSLNVFK